MRIVLDRLNLSIVVAEKKKVSLKFNRTYLENRKLDLHRFFGKKFFKYSLSLEIFACRNVIRIFDCRKDVCASVDTDFAVCGGGTMVPY